MEGVAEPDTVETEPVFEFCDNMLDGSAFQAINAMSLHVSSWPVGTHEFDSFSIFVNDGGMFGGEGELDVLGFGDFLHFMEVGVVVGEFFHELLVFGEVLLVAHCSCVWLLD